MGCKSDIMPNSAFHPCESDFGELSRAVSIGGYIFPSYLTASTGFLYDGKKLLHETSGLGGTETELYSNDMESSYGGLITEYSSGTTLYHMYDAQANTALLADSTGATLTYTSHHIQAFGQRPDGMDETALRGWGRQVAYHYDTEIDLYLMGMSGGGALGNGGPGRHYDADLGRFMSPDPLRAEGGNINIFILTGNNPVTGKDPSGRDANSGTSSNNFSPEQLEKIRQNYALPQEPPDVGTPAAMADALARAKASASGRKPNWNIDVDKALMAIHAKRDQVFEEREQKGTLTPQQADAIINELDLENAAIMEECLRRAQWHSDVANKKIQDDQTPVRPTSYHQAAAKAWADKADLIRAFLTKTTIKWLAAVDEGAWQAQQLQILGGLGVVAGMGAVPEGMPGEEVAPPQAAENTASSKSINTADGQLQSKFKHADDFGVSGNYNKANASKFSDAINQHINSPDVQVIQGTYRGNPATFYLNPKTGLNVIVDPKGNFVSGWKLSPQQMNSVLTSGKLGGG